MAEPHPPPQKREIEESRYVVEVWECQIDNELKRLSPFNQSLIEINTTSVPPLLGSDVEETLGHEKDAQCLQRHQCSRAFASAITCR